MDRSDDIAAGIEDLANTPTTRPGPSRVPEATRAPGAAPGIEAKPPARLGQVISFPIAPIPEPTTLPSVAAHVPDALLRSFRPAPSDAHLETARSGHVPEADASLRLATGDKIPLRSAARSAIAARPARSLLRRAVGLAGFAMLFWLLAMLALIVAFRFVDPPASALMLRQRLKGEAVAQIPVRLSSVSPNVIKAVLLSEDGRFCDHWGVDLDEMQNAIGRSKDGLPRGASTISMQVTKNLFLWSSKSYLRKAIEIPLTVVMEALWPKRRIMEIYLNIAEWGPGIFGVEAAARYHFNKSASHLTEREAAQLAVALPNPILRDAGDPGPRTQRLASEIQGRMRAATRSATACVLTR